MWLSDFLNSRARSLPYAAPPGLRALLTVNQWLAPLAKLCRRSAALAFTPNSGSRNIALTTARSKSRRTLSTARTAQQIVQATRNRTGGTL